MTVFISFALRPLQASPPTCHQDPAFSQAAARLQHPRSSLKPMESKDTRLSLFSFASKLGKPIESHGTPPKRRYQTKLEMLAQTKPHYWRQTKHEHHCSRRQKIFSATSLEFNTQPTPTRGPSKKMACSVERAGSSLKSPQKGYR